MPFKPGNKLFLMPKRDRPPKPVLADLDGRTNIAKDARRIFGRIVADRGGLDQMSEAEIQLAKSAAVDCAFLQSRTADLFEGKTIDLPTFVMLQNAQRRALQAIGLKRVPRRRLSMTSFARTNKNARPPRKTTPCHDIAPRHRFRDGQPEIVSVVIRWSNLGPVAMYIERCVLFTDDGGRTEIFSLRRCSRSTDQTGSRIMDRRRQTRRQRLRCITYFGACRSVL